MPFSRYPVEREASRIRQTRLSLAQAVRKTRRARLQDDLRAFQKAEQEKQAVSSRLITLQTQRARRSLHPLRW